MLKNRRQASIKTNAILNIIKQCCNIVFPLLTYPYVSRTLGASTLGRYSFADSIIQYAVILSTLGASGYAIREGARIRDDKDSISKFAGEILSINIISLVVSYLMVTILIVFVDRIKKEEILIIILSLNMIATVLGRDWINSIYEDFVFITFRYIFFQFAAIILMFLMVKNSNDLYKYATVVLVGNAGAQVANIFHTYKTIPIKIYYGRELLQHVKPMIFMFCIAVASIIYINSDITMLGFFRTDEEVGIYYMTGKIYSLIKTLMNAIIVVSIPRVSYYLGKNDVARYNQLLLSLKKYLFTLLIPCIIGLLMLSENVLFIIGGEEFVSGTLALRVLCLAMFFAVFGSYYAHAILVPNRRESSYFAATIVSALVNMTLNLFFIPVMGIEGAAITTLISELIVLLVCVFSAKGLYCKRNTAVFKSVFWGTLSIVIVCAAIKLIQIGFVMETIISILLSAVVYFMVITCLKNEIALAILEKIRYRKR